MEKLGQKQTEILNYIAEYSHQNGFPPTVREICSAVKLKSTSTVHAHLKALQRLGYIEMPNNKQRSITLCSTDVKTTTPVSIIGTVAAGQPLYAYDNIQETFLLPNALLKGGKSSETFILTITGTSMIDIGILDGDLVIVSSSLVVDSVDIAVVRVDGENATVKRFFSENDHVRLQPENTSMQPIIITKDRVEILGKVIGLISRY